MGLTIKWFIYRHYLLMVFASFVLTILAAAILYAVGADWKVLLSVVGGLLSFIYFVQRQQLEEAKLIKDLISDFNKRYDNLNEQLNEITQPWSEENAPGSPRKSTLDDYFNLCSEEYLFYRRGYIYPEVWSAWSAGMQIYIKNDKVRRIWDDDPSNESYYGLAEYVSRHF